MLEKKSLLKEKKQGNSFQKWSVTVCLTTVWFHNVETLVPVIINGEYIFLVHWLQVFWEYSPTSLGGFSLCICSHEFDLEWILNLISCCIVFCSFPLVYLFIPSLTSYSKTFVFSFCTFLTYWFLLFPALMPSLHLIHTLFCLYFLGHATPCVAS